MPLFKISACLFLKTETLLSATQSHRCDRQTSFAMCLHIGLFLRSLAKNITWVEL